MIESSEDDLDLDTPVTLQTNDISCIWDEDKGAAWAGCEEEPEEGTSLWTSGWIL